jgi:hypothetical protein
MQQITFMTGDRGFHIVSQVKSTENYSVAGQWAILINWADLDYLPSIPYNDEFSDRFALKW